MAFENFLGIFFIFLAVLDTYEAQWYAKTMYVSSISPLAKTKPKFPFRHIVIREYYKKSSTILDRLQEFGGGLF